MFNFAYLTDYVSPVLAVHKAGVLIEYVSEDIILSRMNNYPQKALDKYGSVFSKLIKWYNKHTPNNLKLCFFRISDRYDKEKLVNKVNELLPERKAEWRQFSKEEKKRELHRSCRSVMWKGQKDLIELSEKQKHDRIVESRLIEIAFYEIESKKEFLGDYLERDNHVCVNFSFGTTQDNDEYQELTLGSSYGSLVDFWIGRGIFEKKGERFIPKIVSKNQYFQLKGKTQRVEINNLLPFSNYAQIEMLRTS